MDLWLDDEIETSSDPLDTVENVLGADERFQCERAQDGDVHFSFKCASGETVGYFSYRHAGLINENLWLGHFDVWSDDGTIIFRHAMPMIGRDEISIGEVQAMLAAAMDAAERFQPAFHFLILAGMTAEDAAKAALFEVCGEA